MRHLLKLKDPIPKGVEKALHNGLKLLQVQTYISITQACISPFYMRMCC
jgi:hypothetical protein